MFVEQTIALESSSQVAISIFSCFLPLFPSVKECLKEVPSFLKINLVIKSLIKGISFLGGEWECFVRRKGLPSLLN